MFCKHCGMKNPEGSLYCINDGQPLTALKEGAEVKRNLVKFCKSCSHEIEANSLYCSKCGVAQEVVVENNTAAAFDVSVAGLNKLKGAVPTNLPGTVNFSNLFNSSTIIQSAKFSAIAVGILFFISFIISYSINSWFKGILEDEFFGEAAGLISKLKLVSVTDIMMLGHLTGVDYAAEMLILEGRLSTSGGLLIFALIPAVALIIAGYLANRNATERTAIERFYSAIPIAIVYAAILGVVGLFAGVSISVPDPSGWFGEITVKAEYNFTTVLLNSFILATVFTTIGSMIGLSKDAKGLGGNISYGVSIHRAVLHSVIGLIICGVVAYGVIGTKDEFKNDDMQGPAKTIILSQVGGYFWNLAHFNTLSFEFSDRWDDVKAEYSILGGGKATEDEEEFREMIKEIFGNPWYLFLVPLLLHFWAGNEIRKSTANNILNELGAYAIVFGLVNALIFSISKFSLETNIDSSFSVSFGFPFFTTFLFGAAFAFAVAYVGVMFTNNKNQVHS